MDPSTVDRSPLGLGGAWWGLGAGAAVWIGYFAYQADHLHGAAWENYVLPGLGVLTGGALLGALVPTRRRRWFLMFAGGVLLTIPVFVVVAAILLFAIIHPD